MLSQKKGFTLIELLVVIAIIAVLAAILFPVFAKAREQARAASCLSNLKEIGTALQMYLGDNGEQVPCRWDYYSQQVNDWYHDIASGHAGPVNDAQATYLKTCSTKAQLDPYVKNNNIWKCPSDSNCDPSIVVGKRFTSYHDRHWWHVSLYFGSFGPQNFVFSPNVLIDPSRSWAFGELVPFHDFRLLPGQTESYYEQPDCKFNCVFLDGHAKSMAVDKAMDKYMVGSYYAYDLHWPRRRDAFNYVIPWQTDSFPQACEALEDLDP